MPVSDAQTLAASDRAVDGFITILVRICDVCGDHPKQETHTENAWPRYWTDEIELVKCEECGKVVCHSCLHEFCCEQTQSERQRKLFDE